MTHHTRSVTLLNQCVERRDLWNWRFLLQCEPEVSLWTQDCDCEAVKVGEGETFGRES
jgi:hypothetical protein